VDIRFAPALFVAVLIFACVFGYLISGVLQNGIRFPFIRRRRLVEAERTRDAYQREYKILLRRNRFLIDTHERLNGELVKVNAENVRLAGERVAAVADRDRAQAARAAADSRADRADNLAAAMQAKAARIFRDAYRVSLDGLVGMVPKGCRAFHTEIVGKYSPSSRAVRSEMLTFSHSVGLSPDCPPEFVARKIADAVADSILKQWRSQSILLNGAATANEARESTR